MAGGPAMLHMSLQFLIVMIASAISDRLQRKLECVEEEMRMLLELLEAATGARSSPSQPSSVAGSPRWASSSGATVAVDFSAPTIVRLREIGFSEPTSGDDRSSARDGQ
jgi:hypothetical protein